MYDELTPTSLSLSAIQISQEEIYNALTVLDPTKAAGINVMIDPVILKYCATALTLPLHYLLPHSIKYSFPSEWQLHCITPMFKSGDKNNVANYRLISLLCTVSKLLEHIMYDKVLKFIPTVSHFPNLAL